jgi:hypothetical protein
MKQTQKGIWEKNITLKNRGDNSINLMVTFLEV